MYELHEKLKIGLEGYYFSPQKLSDGATGEEYWIFGLMMEKLWEDFSIFLNFENFTDTRQTRFDSIYTGSISAIQGYLCPSGWFCSKWRNKIIFLNKGLF